MQRLKISLHGFRPLRHRAIDPDAQGHGVAPAQIPGEPGGDLYGHAQFTGAHPTVEVCIVGDRWMLDEIGRAGEVEHIILAGGGRVPVEHGERQVLDIQADAVAHDEHQDDAAEHRQGRPDRIAPQLKRFPPRIAHHPPQAETGGRRGLGMVGSVNLYGISWLRFSAVRLLQIVDEGFLEVRRAPAFDDVRRGVADQDLPGVHQRDAIAALRFVHEVCGDEDGHHVPAGQVDHTLPELVAGDRIDARGRFVQDQHLGLVDHRDSQRQPLALAKRQGAGQRIHDIH